MPQRICWGVCLTWMNSVEKTMVSGKVAEISRNSPLKYTLYSKNSLEKVAKKEYIICKGAD